MPLPWGKGKSDPSFSQPLLRSWMSLSSDSEGLGPEQGFFSLTPPYYLTGPIQAKDSDTTACPKAPFFGVYGTVVYQAPSLSHGVSFTKDSNLTISPSV